MCGSEQQTKIRATANKTCEYGRQERRAQENYRESSTFHTAELPGAFQLHHTDTGRSHKVIGNSAARRGKVISQTRESPCSSWSERGWNVRNDILYLCMFKSIPYNIFSYSCSLESREISTSGPLFTMTARDFCLSGEKCIFFLRILFLVSYLSASLSSNLWVMRHKWRSK